MFDYLIVGAGFSGAVLAERLASQLGLRVLIIDRREHVGGNAYDELDRSGVMIHRYGPHIFHTASERVFRYLSRFTEWRPYEHRVMAEVDGKLVPFPINLTTLKLLYGVELDAAGAEAFFRARAEPRASMRTSEDAVVGKIGRDLYDKFFRNYTRKQWGLDPSELDASVAARVPARCNHDDRYFTDDFQAMPLHGYTKMFHRMLAHPNIHVRLKADYRQVRKEVPHRRTVFTGPIDEYFDYAHGKLPYRSLGFELETHAKARYQSAAVINYPNEHAYTRVTEFKRLTGQSHPQTTIVREYPKAQGDAYYPIPRPQNAEIYRKYQAMAAVTPDVEFVGRLGTYKYYNMDQCVAQALATFEQIRSTRSVAA